MTTRTGGRRVVSRVISAFISYRSCSCQHDITPQLSWHVSHTGMVVSTYVCDENTRSPGDPCFLRVVSWTVTFPAGGMYHAEQSVPEGLLGGTCALQEQTAVLKVVARTARYCVRWWTLGTPRLLRRHTGCQYHRIDDAEAVPTTAPPIVTFFARPGRR